MHGDTRNDQTKEAAERYLSACEEYTDPYEREKLIRDWAKKSTMAENVVGDFKRRATDPAGKKVLDIGFGSGSYVIAFAGSGAHVSGLEVNQELLDIAQGRVREAGVEADLHIYDGDHFPFADNSFDCAYSISVIEHVSDAQTVLNEIARVLKPGGVLYLAFPNRWTPRETHTGVYFVGYFPRKIAELVLRRVYGRNSIKELNLHFLSFTSLKRLLRKTPLRVRFEYGGDSRVKRILKRILGAVGLHHSAILSSVMVVLQKT
jgi:ubiquinone/menaquinone biosynthesis C-methylase UbiE